MPLFKWSALNEPIRARESKAKLRREISYWKSAFEKANDSWYARDEEMVAEVNRLVGVIGMGNQTIERLKNQITVQAANFQVERDISEALRQQALDAEVCAQERSETIQRMSAAEVELRQAATALTDRNATLEINATRFANRRDAIMAERDAARARCVELMAALNEVTAGHVETVGKRGNSRCPKCNSNWPCTISKVVDGLGE